MLGFDERSNRYERHQHFVEAFQASQEIELGSPRCRQSDVRFHELKQSNRNTQYLHVQRDPC